MTPKPQWKDRDYQADIFLKVELCAATKKLKIKYKKTNKSKNMEKYNHITINQKKAGVLALISNKIYFRTKIISRHKNDFIITNEY